MKGIHYRKVFSWVLCLFIIVGLSVGLSGCGKKEALFSQDMEMRDKAYVDIVAITPTYSVGSMSYSTDVVCKCRTAQGETVWVYMSYEEYGKYFDPDAKLGSTMVSSSDADTCIIRTRIHGIAWNAGNVAPNLEDRIGCGKVLHLESANIEEFDESTATAAEPVKFTQEAQDLQYVYAEIQSIDHTQWLYKRDPLDFSSSDEEEEAAYICLCTTTDGETVLFYVDADLYNTYLSNNKYGKFPIKISGYARVAEEVYEHAAVIFDGTMMICYYPDI